VKYLHVLAVFLTMGCGSENTCGGALVGTWIGDVLGDKLTFTKECTFSHDLCGSSGSTESFSGNSGAMSVTVEKGENPLCRGKGNYECAFDIDDDFFLSYSCGSGAMTYERQ